MTTNLNTQLDTLRAETLALRNRINAMSPEERLRRSGELLLELNALDSRSQAVQLALLEAARA